MVERRTHKPKVKGSIPFLATNFLLQVLATFIGNEDAGLAATIDMMNIIMYNDVPTDATASPLPVWQDHMDVICNPLPH